MHLVVISLWDTYRCNLSPYIQLDRKLKVILWLVWNGLKMTTGTDVPPDEPLDSNSLPADSIFLTLEWNWCINSIDQRFTGYFLSFVTTSNALVITALSKTVTEKVEVGQVWREATCRTLPVPWSDTSAGVNLCFGRIWLLSRSLMFYLRGN